MIWKILEIEKTKDEEEIRSAYRQKLRHVNPEDDEEGFKELRRAYEEALEYASEPEESDVDSTGENAYAYGKKSCCWTLERRQSERTYRFLDAYSSWYHRI